MERSIPCCVLLALSGLPSAFCEDVSRVPVGSLVTLPSFTIHPKWRQYFPADKPFFAEKHPDESLLGMHRRSTGRLDGASVTLHEGGNLKSLAYYPKGQRQGACCLWDEDQQLLLYSQCKDGKNHGVTCLFREGKPWFVQHWNAGERADETLVSAKGDDYVAVDDRLERTAAESKLTVLMQQFNEDEAALKTRLRQWAGTKDAELEDAKSKAARHVGVAKMEADIQRSRQESDARTAAAHTWRDGTRRDRVGRTAAADQRMAAQDRKAASKKTAATAASEKQKVGNISSAMEGETKELYEFGLTAMETAMPSESGGIKTYAGSATKTYLVTYQTAGKNGSVHTDEIVAGSKEEAKAKVRAYRAHAKFRKVIEK